MPAGTQHAKLAAVCFQIDGLGDDKVAALVEQACRRVDLDQREKRSAGLFRMYNACY